MKAISVQRDPRPSNQSCGLPSICASSPTHGRRGRGGCKRWRRPLATRHRPASIIQPRSVSLESSNPSPRTYSAAKVGPKSPWHSRTRASTSALTASASRRFESLPRRRLTNPTAPWPSYRRCSRRTCRSDNPNACAAARWLMTPSATRRSTSSRLTSFPLISIRSTSETSASHHSGHF